MSDEPVVKDAQVQEVRVFCARGTDDVRHLPCPGCRAPTNRCFIFKTDKSNEYTQMFICDQCAKVVRQQMDLADARSGNGRIIRPF